MRLVMKFGGTSVGDEKCIANVVKIVKESRDAGNEIAVVVSAMTRVTDQLIATAEEVINCKQKPALDAFIASIRSRHMKVLEAVAPDYVTEIGECLDSRITKLSNILLAIHNLRELTPRSKDYIISFGERLSAPIISAALRQAGIPSCYMSGCDAGILTDGVHNGATALPESYARIQARVGALLTEQVPVIMGYMGCAADDAVTTLGRSGSDYSGAIVGAGIDADEILIWTDVDGVMTTDPRLIPEARVINSISFLEMMEMSYFGAKVIHPRALVPAMQKNIPVRVKNTFNPNHPGTVVIREPHADKRIVKAISLIQNSCLIKVGGAIMAGKPGVAGEIFTTLAEAGVNVMLISQGSSEMTISMIITEEQLDAALTALAEVKQKGFIREFDFDRDVAVVSVVGAGMAGTYGTLGRIFRGLGVAGINVMMLSQGSEVNVSFVVKQADGVKAVRAIHEEYHLEEEEEA
ncbi:MAG: aspartate kinase [Methanocorpusculum sp.]|nr:aspartate kinase [Methanocorpusculum sp.]